MKPAVLPSGSKSRIQEIFGDGAACDAGRRAILRWISEILSPVLGGSAATAAARPQDAPRATLGTPAWALNPHTRCAAAPRSALLPEFRRPRRGRRGRRRPSVRVPRPCLAGVALRRRGGWPPGPARSGWPRHGSRNDRLHDAYTATAAAAAAAVSAAAPPAAPPVVAGEDTAAAARPRPRAGAAAQPGSPCE